MNKLIEIVVEVRNLNVKLLFPEPPTFWRICRVLSDLFERQPEIGAGMEELIMSVGDQDRDRIMTVDDMIQFDDDTGNIGSMTAQTRTIFDN
jgi:hypothetical protein